MRWQVVALLAWQCGPPSFGDGGRRSCLHLWGAASAIPELVNAFMHPCRFLKFAGRCCCRLIPLTVWDKRLAEGWWAYVRPAVYSGVYAMAISLGTRDSGMARHVFRYGIDDDGLGLYGYGWMPW